MRKRRFSVKVDKKKWIKPISGRKETFMEFRTESFANYRKN